MRQHHTIVIDIETIPQSFESLDESVQDYLLKWADGEEDEDTVKKQMALWAPTNTIVAIGMQSIETKKGAVYIQADPDMFSSSEEHQGFTYVSGSEKEMLERFWKSMMHARRFVTFNGRRFDCPVLMLRSAILGVVPTINLMPYRYAHDRHVDLLEQLTFYGATKKFDLNAYCRAFGIASPKAQGVTGHNIKPLFDRGAYKTIASYCAGDVVATRQLFEQWDRTVGQVVGKR